MLGFQIEDNWWEWNDPSYHFLAKVKLVIRLFKLYVFSLHRVDLFKAKRMKRCIYRDELSISRALETLTTLMSPPGLKQLICINIR